MSLTAIESELARFITSTEPEVLCLRGQWGVGKSYLWERAIRNSATAGRVGLQKYSYVSLFGLDSLDQLKYAVFENSVDAKSMSTGPTVETWDKNVSELGNRLGRKFGTQLIAVLRGKDAATIAQSLAFLSFSETIVCIDDLERKGRNLSIKDVLGLVSHLKEKKKCKVVLIYNDVQLAEDDAEAKDFGKHSEKVVDISVNYAPTAEENIAAAFPKATELGNMLASRCRTLKISNIRVLKKIERIAIRVAPLLEALDHRVLEQAVHTLSLFGWLIYTGQDAMAAFAKAKRGRGMYGKTGGKLTAEEQEWDNLLDRCEFSNADAFDLVLIDGIRSGYFDFATIRQAAEERDRAIKAGDAEASFQAAWRLYHDSFDDNEAELVERLLSSFMQSARQISQSNLNGTVVFLKELGHADKAAQIIEHYMADHQAEGRDFFDVSEISSFGEISDPDVQQAFTKTLQTFDAEHSPEEALRAIGGSQGWNAQDERIANALTADRLYKIFKGANGRELRQLIRGALVGKRTAGAERLKPLADRAEGVLQRIASESALNRLRVEKFGVRVNETPDKEESP
ncbi:P-loop NTPase fold protein [Reyranella sp.]|uniref:P-loop NTPase fold protein n=1 Tax=Reyranella sp. TaxID=1929291 RepID=UPI003D0E6778